MPVLLLQGENSPASFKRIDAAAQQYLTEIATTGFVS
jgi:hypothetical protein